MVGNGDSTDEERLLLERCRFHDVAPRQWAGLTHRGRHSLLGLAPTRHRLHLRGCRGAGAAAIFDFSVDRHPVGRRRLADRRRARLPSRPASGGVAAGGVRRRLVDGLRLFSRRPLVDRLGASGRGRQIRLGAAACGCGAAGCARPLSGRRLRARAPLVVAGTDAHFRPRLWAWVGGMGARPPVYRLPLERPRDGARRQSGACPDRLARRLARAHLSHDRDLRGACDALAGERQPVRSGADDCRGACARSPRRLWRVPADGAPQRDLAGRETAPHPAQCRPGRRHVRPAEQPSDPAPLFRPVGARDLARSIRNSRRYAPDLARVGVSIHFGARSRWRFPRSSTSSRMARR